MGLSFVRFKFLALIYELLRKVNFFEWDSSTRSIHSYCKEWAKS